MYQRAILTAASVIALSASAFASDLSLGTSAGYKDAPYVPIQTWSGFYFGAGGGGGAVNHNLGASLGTAASADLKGIGGMGGFGTVQAGYDRQFGPRFVAGVFFDYDFAVIESSATANIGATSYTAKGTLTDMWTAGGRAGYLVNRSTLVYGLAGYSEAHFNMPFGLNGDFTGWTAGAGMETRIAGPVFLKGEYRFSRLDEKTIFSAGTFAVTDQPDVQTGRLVLTYKLSNSGYDFLK
jgi:outer membrane immunogenic protein